MKEEARIHVYFSHFIVGSLILVVNGLVESHNST